eukprot:3102532-Prymnesium_polylepis.2
MKALLMKALLMKALLPMIWADLGRGASFVTWPLLVEAEVLSAHEERDAALSELRQKRSIEAELLQSSARFEQQIASNSSAFEEEKAALLTQIGGLKEEFEKFKKANDGKKKPPTDPALDGMSVIDQIRYTLKKNAARVLDLFREWDEDGDGQVLALSSSVGLALSSSVGLALS